MMTFESVSAFVEQRIKYASRNPQYAQTFESQAFGAVDFACQNADPELQNKLSNAWDEWRTIFEQMYK